MSIPTDLEIEKINRPPAEQRIIVQNVSWETYEHLLSDLVDQSSPRLTYDRGTLEIMAPLPEHERINRLVASIIDIIAEELNIDVLDLGSTTFKRADLGRGFEPDSCFYFEHAAEMRVKKEIDLTTDPAPELVVEVDITSASFNKFPIYAQMSVPEVWRHNGKVLTIYKLSGETYTLSSNGVKFPFIAGDSLSQFLESSYVLARPEFLKSVREWIRKQRAT